MSIFNMLRYLSVVLLYSVCASLWAHGDHDKPAQEHKEAHASHLSADIAKEAGIVVAKVSGGNIERHIQVYGRLVTPPTHQAQVRARFPGLVVSLYATTGDKVKAGQVLAVVESNESLRRYEIKAPITGMVQERFINQGEVSGDAPLFTLLNQDELWAELNLFPLQRREIKVGQAVHIRHNDHDHNSKIQSITPAPNNASRALPYVVARVPLKNDHQDMAAGDKVLADIDAELVNAKVRVALSAIMEIEGQKVVFVHEHNSYQAVPISLGVQDDHFAEVLAGLVGGEDYVVQNSYLLKADLGKSEAEHEH